MATEKSKQRKQKELVRLGLGAKQVETERDQAVAQLAATRARIRELEQERDQARLTTDEVQAELERTSDQFGKDRVSKDTAIERLVAEIEVLKEELRLAQVEASELHGEKVALLQCKTVLERDLLRERKDGKSARAARRRNAELAQEVKDLTTRLHRVVKRYVPEEERAGYLHHGFDAPGTFADLSGTFAAPGFDEVQDEAVDVGAMMEGELGRGMAPAVKTGQVVADLIEGASER